MTQKGVHGVVVPAAISLLVIGLMQYLNQIVQWVRTNVFDELYPESLFANGFFKGLFTWSSAIYSILLLTAAILMIVYCKRKPTGIIGGSLLILNIIINVVWTILTPILLRNCDWETVFFISRIENAVASVIYLAAITLIAVSYRHGGMITMAILVSVFRIALLFVPYAEWYYWVVYFHEFLFSLIYLFMWAKQAKLS